MNYDIVSPHVSEWLEDECDRTELDFVLDAQPDEDYGDELLNQVPLLPAEEISPDEQPTENQPTYIETN